MRTIESILLNEKSEMLDSQMMKLIKAGIGTCGVYVKFKNLISSGPFTAPDNTGMSQFYSFSNFWVVIRGISYNDATSTFTNYSGQNWCCDSCDDTTWYWY